MALGTWWIVNDTTKRILAGPFWWDDAVNTIPVSAPLRVTNINPEPLGYTVGTLDIGALAARVTALEKRVMGEVRGVGAVPAIANVTGGTINCDVTLKASVRDGTGAVTMAYTPSAILIPGVLVGTVSIPSDPTVLDTNKVRVPIKSTGVVALGQATVLVFADANA